MAGTLAIAGDGLELEHVACNLCGSRASRLLYRKPDTRHWVSPHPFDVVRCRGCGLGYVNPRPTRAGIARFYPPAFYERREVSDERARYERQAAFLDGYARGRVLDIGCATGAFLAVLAERGWEPEGMDLLPSGRRLDVPVRYGELPDLRYPTARFDAVTAWAVFEHLHDPAAYFREVGRILKPGGHFVCLVTNLDSVWSRFAYGEDVPRHLHFFSTRTLARYAALAGLRLERVDRSGAVFPADSTDVFRVRLLRRLGVDWRAIHGPASGWPPAARPLARLARAAGVVLLRPRLESWLGIGAILIAVMEKPR
jgi:SAM-dependent methyltransferase